MTVSRTPLGLCSQVRELPDRLDRGRFLLPLIKIESIRNEFERNKIEKWVLF